MQDEDDSLGQLLLLKLIGLKSRDKLRKHLEKFTVVVFMSETPVFTGI